MIYVTGLKLVTGLKFVSSTSVLIYIEVNNEFITIIYFMISSFLWACTILINCEYSKDPVGRGGVLSLILLGMCRWPLSTPNPMSVIFGLVCNFRDPSLVTFYFYELIHFLDWMENTLLFFHSTNIQVSLLIGNMKNCLTPKNPKICDPF